MSVYTTSAVPRCILVFAFLIVAAMGIAPRASAQTLTNADVVKMVRAKLSDALIISEINHSTCNFDASPNELIKLKQAGVSDAVLQALTEARHAPSPAEGASPSNSNAPISAAVITAGNAASLRPRVVTRFHGNVYGLKSSANGNVLAVWVVGLDQGASVMDTTTGDILQRMPSAQTPITLSADGTLLASGPDASLWVRGRGSPLEHHAQPGSLRDLVFSPQQTFLAIATTQSVSIWAVPGYARVSTDRVLCDRLAFSNDGELLAGYGPNSTLRIWNARGITSLLASTRPPTLAANEHLNLIRFGPKSSVHVNTTRPFTIRLVSVQVYIGTNRRTIRVGYSGRAGWTIRNLNIPVPLVAISPDGSIGVSVGNYVGHGSGGYSPLTFWNLATSRPIAEKKNPDIPSAFAFSMDGSKLFCGTIDGEVVVWSVAGSEPASGSPVQPGMAPSAAQPSTPMQTPAPVATAGCGDFGACMHAGVDAYKYSNLSIAISDFKRAANQRPMSSKPWRWLGLTYVRTGQSQDFSRAWDKALSLHGTIPIGSCYLHGFHSCSRGELFLSVNSMEFRDIQNQTLFDTTPSQVTPTGVHKSNAFSGNTSFGLRLGSKNYNFDFFPIGVKCYVKFVVQCPAPGLVQQLVVADYIEQTIPKLASGALTASAPPPPSQPSAPATAQTSASGEKSEDLVYIPSYEGIGLLEFQPGHPFFRHIAKTTGTNDYLVVYNRRRIEFYVGQENGNQIPIISGDSFAQSGSLTDSVGWNTSDLVLSHNCSRLVATGSGGKVLVFDSSSRTLIRKFFVPTRSYPTYVAFSPDDHWLYFSSGNHVFVYDSTNFQLARQKSFPGWSASPLAISPDGTALLLLENSAVVRLSTSSLDVVSSLRLPEATIDSYHSHLQISRDGSAVWVAGKKAIYRVSLVSGGLTSVRPPGTPTDREYQFAQSSDGKDLYVLCGTSASAELLTLDVKMGVIVGRISDVLSPTMVLACPTGSQPPEYSKQTSAASQLSKSCSGTTSSLDYSIQDGQHTYKVEAIGSPGPDRVHVFLDESGAVVRDSNLLRQLALGAWSKEMVIDRYTPASGSEQVKGFLGNSSNLQGWENATDILARATVESIRAVVTVGASLDTAPQSLTLGIVKRQLINPKVALAHWAHAGLLQSLADYQQMERLLPPAGTTVLKLTDLQQIESLYTQASTLASVNEALAAAIAPTSWQDEFANYISSALSELESSLPPSTTFLTLNNVLKLEELVAAAGQSFSAYKHSLDLALMVATSTQGKITAWATEAATACANNAAASAAPAPAAANNAFAMLPSFSPDGSKVAFIQFHIEQMSYGPSRSGFRVCIADLKKRTLSCLPESLPTGAGKVSVSAVRPVFTTDDKKVLFVAETAKFTCNAIYVSRLDASGLRRLTGCTSFPRGISVSPDGTSFAFNSSESLSIQRFSGNAATTVWTPPKGAGEHSGEMDAGNYAFSPDATRIVFSAYNAKALLYTRDLRAHTTSNLVSYGSQLQESGLIFPAFAPNGRQVAFSAAVGPVVPSPTGSAYYHEIFRVALNGGAPVRLTKDKRMDIEPRFADGGNRIIFASCGRQDAGLYSMGLNGEDKRLVTQLNLRACSTSGVPHFDVSSDGQKIVFEDAGSRPGTDLYIVGFQGNGRVRLMDLLNR